MLTEYAIVPSITQTEQARPSKSAAEWKAQAPLMSGMFGEDLLAFLLPLVEHLHEANKVDKRPLKTLVQAVEAIVAFREAGHGLLLWELGGYMDQLQGGGGGTKRLETLIHHDKWKAHQIEDFLLCRAECQVQEWEGQGEDGLLIWDGTILEKPESLKGEGLCPVRSSKGKRLTQMKKGYYRPPGAPIYVLTNEAIITAEDAWRIVFAYMRRWRIEMSFRHLKSDMAIQSLRVYRWEDRLKLLGLLTLAYGFLMNLMREEVRAAREWLLDFACHRRGRRTREVDIPFSRVRLALSKLWLAFPCWFVRRGKLNL